MCDGEILMTRTLAKIRVQNFDVFYTSEFLFRPNIKMPMCYSLVKPTWYPLFSFTWNSIPGEARCWVFLRNWVTHREHLPLDIFGGWHFSISPIPILKLLEKESKTVQQQLQRNRNDRRILYWVKADTLVVVVIMEEEWGHWGHQVLEFQIIIHLMISI